MKGVAETSQEGQKNMKCKRGHVADGESVDTTSKMVTHWKGWEGQGCIKGEMRKRLWRGWWNGKEVWGGFGALNKKDDEANTSCVELGSD